MWLEGDKAAHPRGTGPPGGDRARRPAQPTVAIGVALDDACARLVALDDAGGVLRTQETGLGDLTPAELLHQIRLVAADAPIDAIGIGMSSLVGRGVVVAKDNSLAAASRAWLSDLVSAEFGVPCVTDNDALTAAIGENTSGRADSLLMVTLDTVIGVGLVVDGRPVRCADGSHPEAGHLPVPGVSAPCRCGLPTCWEQVASRPALDHLTSGHTAEFAARAHNNDVVAQTVFDLYGSRVAAGLAILLPLFRPARLVLGGSAAQYLPLFSPALDANLQRSAGYSYGGVRVAATLGAMSAAIGAAILARQAEQQRVRSAAGLHL